MKPASLFFAVLFLFLNLGGCSHGQCTNVPQREEAQALINSTATPSANDPILKPKLVPNKVSITEIFKASGEKQCGEGTPITLEAMKETLTKSKVQVLDAKTTNDGLIHMSVCGAASGQIHVFTIKKTDLKKALALGFKIFKDHK